MANKYTIDAGRLSELDNIIQMMKSNDRYQALNEWLSSLEAIE